MALGMILLTIALRAASKEQAVLVKMAVDTEDDVTPLILTAITALGQLLITGLLLKVEGSRGDLPNREALSVIVCAHLGASFLSTYLASLGQVYTSLASGFAEPVLALAALWIVTSVPPRPQPLFSLLLFMFGSTFSCLNLTTVLQSDRTSLIQGLAGFTLVLRNIVARHLVHNENVKVEMRGSPIVTGLVVTGGCVMAALYTVTSPEWLGPAFCAMTSMLVSAFLTYVTMCVLKRYSVAFASLFHIIALLAESLVLTPMVQRPGVLSAVCAIVVAAIGLYLFMKDCVDAEESSSNLTTFPRKPGK